MSDVYPTLTEIAPFGARFSQRSTAERVERLKNVLWPDTDCSSKWPFSFSMASGKKFVDHWSSYHDWRRLDRTVNSVPHFRTSLRGNETHFVHLRSPYNDALPLLLTHGVPGSFVEFLKVIHPLSDPVVYGGRPEEAFHIVIPSSPGTGFSAPVDSEHLSATGVAHAWADLMGRLGYRKWVAHGSGWGAFVTMAMAELEPEGLLAIHTDVPELTLSKCAVCNASAPGKSATMPACDPELMERDELAFLADVAISEALEMLECAFLSSDGSLPQSVDLRDDLMDIISVNSLGPKAISIRRAYDATYFRNATDHQGGLHRVGKGRLVDIRGSVELVRGKVSALTRLAAVLEPFLFTDQLVRSFALVR